MRRMYQTEWHDIQFSSFTKLSSANLAGPEFYQKFYEEFFKRFHKWEQLSLSWRREKERCAEFILARSAMGSKVLAVGCGLGAIEHYLQGQVQPLDLFIHEVAPSAWCWVGGEFTEERKFLGLIPGCLHQGISFDLIYLSAVDYALEDDALVGLLAALRPFLNSAAGGGARCLLVSASFQDVPPTLQEKIISIARALKTFVLGALDICGLRARGQFWGWSRTKTEYHTLMRRAGYIDIQDGFIDPRTRGHYWIAGR